MLLTISGVKKSLILYVMIKPFLLSSFSILDVPSLPLIDVDRILIIILTLGFIIEYITFRKNLYPKNNPTSKVFFYFILLLLIVVINSSIGIGVSLGFLINLCFENILIVFLLWYYIEEEKHFISLLRIIIFVSIIVNIYGLYNFISNSNPYINIFSQSTDRSLISVYDNVPLRFGFNRAQSTFNHPMVYGAYNVFIFVISFTLNFQKTIKYKLIMPAMALSLIGIFITNSRSPVIFLFISLSYFFISSKIVRKKIYKLLPIIFIVISILFLTVPFVNDLIDAILVPNSVRGSSLEMRVVQFFASLHYFNQSPLTGLGFGKARELNLTNVDKQLYGLESFLFQIMIDGGIIGIIAYLFLFIGLFKIMSSIKNNSKTIFHKNFIIGLQGTLIGYIAFILATGPLSTFPWFFLFIGLTFPIMKFSDKYSVISSIKN